MSSRFRLRGGAPLTLALCLGLLEACGSSSTAADAAPGAADLGPANADAQVVAEDARVTADAAARDADEPDAGPMGPDAMGVADAEPIDLSSPDATAVGEDASATDAGPACPSLLGFPCTQNDQCDPGQVCLTPTTFSPTLGPPAGYCSKPCAGDSDCGPCGVCNEDPGGEGVRICLRTCLPGGQCEVAGQLCNRIVLGIVPTSTSVCFPGDPTARIGDPCRVASECGANQGCYNSPWWVDGICVGEACSLDTPDTCPAGSRCGFLRYRTYCLPECLPGGTCSRPDYDCVSATNHCAQRWGFQEPGNRCSTDLDCGGPNTGLACLIDATHPEGYCTRYNCSPNWPECSPYICQSYDESCPFGSVCTNLPGAMSGTYCARRCDFGSGCVAPYTCNGSICD